MSLIAVIDVETTGLNPYRHDRIVEIAALLIRADGTVVRQFTSLVNPERDIGPTSIHGLVTRDLFSAPRFSDIAGSLVDALEGSVAIAAHNVRFDQAFLTAEFDRLGHSIPNALTLCTMQLAGGGSLLNACADYGVSCDGEAHAAWHDTCAAANLLVTLLKDAPRLRSQIRASRPIKWPSVARTRVMPLTRDESRRCQELPPTYIQKLLARIEPDLPEGTDDSAISDYTALLDRALEDRHVDEEEGQALFDVAERWGISPQQIQSIHEQYLHRLVTAALGDGVVTRAERRDLRQVAGLLGIDRETLSKTLETASGQQMKPHASDTGTESTTERANFSGKAVCFTGECQCRLNGEAITREIASEIASRNGLLIAESVTKKLDLLVVADPLTQSGKAKKARRYGIRIMHERVFWRALGIKVE